MKLGDFRGFSQVGIQREGSTDVKVETVEEGNGYVFIWLRALDSGDYVAYLVFPLLMVLVAGEREL
jgi:hypothetical protein